MKPEHRSLRDVFETIADEARNNPVRHIVALTYEFDDQQLINLLVGRPLDELYEPCGFDLKRIAELTPVVVYDARKTREGQATPHFLELLPVQMPAYTCHHPKALLVVLERSIHLVIGSMNLTRTGLLTNREVFLHLRCNRLETADATVFQEFFSLLESGYASFESEPLARTIAAARDRLAIWNQTAVSTQHLVSSGYGNTGMECMRRLWSEDGRGPALAVLAVSPFFDRASSRRILASELRANFGHFDKLTLVTDASARAHLARSHFARSLSRCCSWCLPNSARQKWRGSLGRTTWQTLANASFNANFMEKSWHCTTEHAPCFMSAAPISPVKPGLAKTRSSVLPGSSTDRGRNWWIKFVPGFPRLRRTSFPCWAISPMRKRRRMRITRAARCGLISYRVSPSSTP